MSRFDISKFKAPPDDEFICGICKNVLDNAKESPCRHVFCQICINRALQEKSKCPICRTSFKEKHLKDVLPLVQNLLNKLPMTCDNFENGCEAPIALERFLDHEKDCEYLMVTCKNISCGKRLLRRDCCSHETKDCQFRKIICDKGCLCSIVFAEKESHDCLTTLLQLNQDLTEKNKDLENRVEELQSIISSFESSKEDHKDNLNLNAGSVLDSDISSRISSPSSFHSLDINVYDTLSEPSSISTSISFSGLPALSDCSDDYRDEEDAWASDRERNSEIGGNQEEVVEEFIPMSDNTQGNEPHTRDLPSDLYFQTSIASSSSNNIINTMPADSFSRSHETNASLISAGASSSSYQEYASSSIQMTGAQPGSMPSGSSRKRMSEDDRNNKGPTKKARSADATETEGMSVRRSARLRQISVSPVNDIECVPVPPPAAYLLDIFSNENNSDSDDSWSPTHNHN